LYYIDHYGAENLKEQEEKDEQDSDYVSRYEMEILEQRIREEAKKEAREEANKSVMTMIGSLVAGMQGNLNIPTAQKQYEPHDDDHAEQTEKDEDDEVVAAYAEKWMMDSIGST
jgi:predicted small lipoprotein YifL